MLLFCKKGCGFAIETPQALIDKMNSMGQAVDVEHTVCPTEGTKVERYRAVVQIFREVDTTFLGDQPDEVETRELIASNGVFVEARSAMEAFDLLSDGSLNQMWHKLQDAMSIADATRAMEVPPKTDDATDNNKTGE